VRTAAVVICSHASPQKRAQVQQQRLSAWLAGPRKHSAVYCERLQGLPDDATSLARMAPVARDDLMRRFDHWMTDPALRLDEMRAFPADPARIGDPYLGRYLIWKSSGTSGALSFNATTTRWWCACPSRATPQNRRWPAADVH